MKGKYWLVLLALFTLFAAGVFLGRGSVLLGSAVLRGDWFGASLGEVSLSRPQEDAPAAGRIELNAATGEQLQELPGIGPSLAQNILEYREKIGGFTQISQLLEVDGIGTGIYDDIKDLLYLAKN